MTNTTTHRDRRKELLATIQEKIDAVIPVSVGKTIRKAIASEVMPEVRHTLSKLTPDQLLDSEEIGKCADRAVRIAEYLAERFLEVQRTS